MVGYVVVHVQAGCVVVHVQVGCVAVHVQVGCVPVHVQVVSQLQDSSGYGLSVHWGAQHSEGFYGCCCSALAKQTGVGHFMQSA